jgi:putative RNA 2'-phosphotransferase
MDRNLANTSKRVSWLLRHGAPERRISMDPAGWVAVSDVLRELRLSEAQLDAIVAQNDKARFERDGDRIRATQGHSALGGAGVALDALEASWQLHESDAPIFHGTDVDAALSIAREGILSQKRSHVHLAPSADSKVGKRWNVDVLLVVEPSRVRAAGVRLFRSPNGVVLARSIPASAVTGVRPLTRRAQARLQDLRAAFGIGPSG